MSWRTWGDSEEVADDEGQDGFNVIQAVSIGISNAVQPARMKYGWGSGRPLPAGRSGVCGRWPQVGQRVTSTAKQEARGA
jgi:hypothetical protein